MSSHTRLRNKQSHQVLQTTLPLHKPLAFEIHFTEVVIRLLFTKWSISAINKSRILRDEKHSRCISRTNLKAFCFTLLFLLELRLTTSDSSVAFLFLRSLEVSWRNDILTFHAMQMRKKCINKRFCSLASVTSAQRIMKTISSAFISLRSALHHRLKLIAIIARNVTNIQT